MCINKVLKCFYFYFQCSYKPYSECKYETETAFKECGAFEGKEYPCYYSPTEPPLVFLKKNKPGGIGQYVTPNIGIFIGIGILLAVKFLGHKFNCPSQSQLIKQQQVPQQDQLQPLQPQSA